MYVLPTPSCLFLRVPRSESYSCLCVSLNCPHVLLLVFHSSASSIRLVLMSASVLQSLGLPCVLVCILVVSRFILTVSDPVFTVFSFASPASLCQFVPAVSPYMVSVFHLSLVRLSAFLAFMFQV